MHQNPVDEYLDALEEPKRALKFGVDSPLPVALLKKLIDARLRELGLA